MEKVQQNKELKSKEYTDHMQKMLDRSRKHEKACWNYKVKDKETKQKENIEKKLKRNTAMGRVKEFNHQRIAEGMHYWSKVKRDIQDRKESKIKRERAQSANIFNQNKFEKEFISLGVTIGAVNRVVGSNRKMFSRNRTRENSTLGSNPSQIGYNNEDSDSVKRQLIKMKEDEELEFQNEFQRIDIKLKLAKERQGLKKSYDAQQHSLYKEKLE